MIAVTCASCQKKLSVRDELAGKKVKCPGCGEVIIAPSLTRSSAGASGISQQSPTVGADRPQSSHSVTAGVTLPPPGLSDATRSPVPDTADHDSSLTDFLAPRQADDELGRLGKYRILKVLGHGGMGVVYKAEDPKLERFVAIKAMLPTLAASASAGKRFLREAQAMAKVKHDHIVTVYQVDEERGIPFLAMEFLAGEPLDVRLQRDRKLPIPEVLRIGREIARGLAAAHVTGLIHRDIKPANIWLEAPEGRVKILDFGLARAAAQQDAGLTQQGAIVGTPSYMAPEQAAAGEIDQRCDLFSLGCVLYRMCTGEQAFRGKDTITTLMAVAMETPVAPEKLNAEVSTGLSNLIMKLLEKDPAQRIATAEEVAETLRRLERDSADTVAASGVVSRSSAIPSLAYASGSDGSRSLFGAKSCLLILALGGGLFVVLAAIVHFWPTATGKLPVVPRDEVIGAKRLSKVEGSPPNYALSFDGKSSYVKIPSLGRDDSGPRTIEAYVIPATLDAGMEKNKDGVPVGAGAIVTQLTDARAFNLSQRAETWASTIRSDTTVSSIVSPPGQVKIGTRVHVATVWDGKDCQLFVDGKRVTNPGVAPAAGFNFSVGRQTMFGANEVKEGLTRFWAGVMDEVRISKVARYSMDFTPAKRFEPDADTLALYHFDEGQGTELRDSSKNGHHGKIVGARWVNTDGSPIVTTKIALPSLPPGAPLSPLALVSRPPAIKGVQSWSIEPRGHRGPIAAVAYSQDSKRFASGGEDGTVRIWDAQSHQLQRVLLGHARKINVVAWSPDGKSLASGSNDKTVHLWDTHTGKLLHVFDKHTGAVRCLAWSPDGKTLASGSMDKLVRLWDVATGVAGKSFDSHTTPVFKIGWQSNSALVSVGIWDNAKTVWFWFWDVNADKSIGHRGRGFTAWTADHKVMAYMSAANTFTFWDAAGDQKRTLTLKDLGPTADFDISPDGTMLVTGSNNLLRWWDAATGELCTTGEQGTVVGTVLCSPDGQMVATRVPDGGWIALWKTDLQKQTGSAKPFKVANMLELPQWTGWSPDSRTVYQVDPYNHFPISSNIRTARFWDHASEKPPRTLDAHWAGDDVAWSPDGRLAVGTTKHQNRIWLWDANTGVMNRSTSKLAWNGGSFLDWSPDGKTLATLSGYEITLFDGTTARHTKNLVGHSNHAMQAIFSPDSKKMATAGDFQSNKVRIFDVASGKGVDLPIARVPDQSMSFSPDSQLLATGGPGLKIWDATTGAPQPLKTAKQKAYIQAVAWSPDGSTLAAGGNDGTIGLWNARTGESLKLFAAHEKSVFELAWLPDSKTLLSRGPKDDSICVCFWQTDRDLPPRIVKGFPPGGRFSPDRRFLVTRHDPTRVQIWEIETGQMRGTFIHLYGQPEQFLAIAADGHYRISAEEWKYVVYVVHTDSGQDIYTPDEFAKKYGWQNDPEKVRIISP